MKGKMLFKKGLAGILSVACIVSMIPQGVFAQEDAGEIVLEDESAYEIVSDESVPDESVIDSTDSDLAVESDAAEVTEVPDAGDMVEEDYAPATTAYTLGTSVSDTLTKGEDDYIVYEFEVAQAGRIKLTTESDGINWRLSGKLKDYYQLSDLSSKKDAFWGLDFGTLYEEVGYEYGDTDPIRTETTLDLIAGKYYLYLAPYLYPLNGNTISYSISTEYTPVKYDVKTEKTLFDTEVFGSKKTTNNPIEIETDQMYVAQSTTDDWDVADWYTFTLENPSSLYITASTEEIDKLEFRMYRYNPIGDPVLLSWEPETPIAIGTQVFDAKAKVIKAVNNYELIDRSDSLYNKKTVYDDGKYFISVNKKHGDQNSICSTGAFRFKILTFVGENVKALKVYKDKTEVKNAVSVPINDTLELTAKVTPDKADQTVRWEIDDPAIATVNNGVITPVAEGDCKLTVTTAGVDSKGEHKTVEITVTVMGEAKVTEAPVVVKKQKVDLYSELFFNCPYDKKEKWEVVPKQAGSVKNGIFTAKNPCKEVTVYRKDKDKNILGQVTFATETPEIAYPVNPKKPSKKLGSVLLYKVGETATISDYIITDSDVEPVEYQFAGKTTNFSFESEDDTAGGSPVLTVLTKGSCKVNVFYNYPDRTGYLNKKYAAKYTISFKTQLPELKKSAKVKVNKTATIKIKNVKPELIKDIEWSIGDPDAEEYDDYGYDYDDDDEYDDEEEEEYDSYFAIVSQSGDSCTIQGIEKGQDILVATVDGVAYKCVVSVK